MSIAQNKGNFCDISGFKPSRRTQDAIKEMNEVVEMSSYLDKAIRLVPFYHIFAGRKSYTGVSTANAGWNASTYEWKLFSEAIRSVDSIQRRRLENIALTTAGLSMGKEKEFWTCIYNAL